MAIALSNPTARGGFIARCLMILALIVAGISSGFAADGNTYSGSGDAIDNFATEVNENQDGVLSEGQEEVTKSGVWLVKLIYLIVVPLVLGLVAVYGIIQHNKNEVASARRAFGAVAVGILLAFMIWSVALA